MSSLKDEVIVALAQLYVLVLHIGLIFLVALLPIYGLYKMIKVGVKR